jgi:hypothetical protein
MPTKYAAGTEVSISRSREEIEKTLQRYGARGFMYGSHGDVAAVAFEMKKRRYRIELNYPPASSFARMANHQVRTPTQQKEAQDREVRRLWRALLMVIKAKLEAVQSGITTIEDEFLAHTVMSNDQTVGQWLEPQVREMYESGEMPPFLPGVRPAGRKQLSSGESYIEGEIV